MTNNRMIALLKVAVGLPLYDGNTADDDLNYLERHGYISRDDNGEKETMGLTQFGLDTVNRMKAVASGQPVLRLVYGITLDGSKALLLRTTPDLDVDKWTQKRKAALKALNIQRVEVEDV